MSSYRCRIHTNEAVTWRGTGCAKCDRVKRGHAPDDQPETVADDMPAWIKKPKGIRR